MTPLLSNVPEARRNAPPGTFLASIKAGAAPIPPQGDVTMMFMPPMGNTIAKQPAGTGLRELVANDRIINTDPRESFYWTLPNKLTPQQCLQMLRAALAGDLFQQFNLCQLMLDTWPTFRMAAHQLCESASYLRYAVHPFAEEGKKPTPSAVKKADLVSRAMRGMAPNPFNDERGFSGMAYNLCDAMLNGLSLVELLWELKPSTDHGREWLPASSAWVHPRHYTFSNGGFVSIYTDDDASRINKGVLTQRPGTQPDPTKFLCGQFISKAGSVLGAGFMRPLVWYWSARQFNNEWMLNTAKQYGSPFIDITYKPGTVGTGPGSELEKLNEMLKTAGAQRRLIHPEGTTAEIHQPSSLGKENPQRVMEEKADEACLFLLLGQKGTTTAVSGQLGNDDSHENVKEERKLGLANWLARNPLRQFARAVLLKNYNDDSECPNIEPDTTKPLKTEQVGMLASSISGSGLPVRADEFYKKIGFTQPEEGETVLVRGELMIQEAAMTKEDKFNEQLGQQVKQAEVQMELQGEAQGQQEGPAQAREGGKAALDSAVRATGTSTGAAKGWTHRVHVSMVFKHGIGSDSRSYPNGEIRKLRLTAASDEEAEQKAHAFYKKREFKNMRTVHIEHNTGQDDAPDKPAQASDCSLRDALIHATDAELAELEQKLTAAENAPHKNGEAEAVEVAIKHLTKRIQF